MAIVILKIYPNIRSKHMKHTLAKVLKIKQGDEDDAPHSRHTSCQRKMNTSYENKILQRV